MKGLLKRVLMCIMAAAVFISAFSVCAFAYEDTEAGFADVHFIRTEQQNTYNICVTYTLSDIESSYGRYVSDLLEGAETFEDTETKFVCNIGIDRLQTETEFWIRGTADSYFDRSWTVTFQKTYTFNKTGKHNIDIMVRFGKVILCYDSYVLDVYPGEFITANNNAEYVYNESFGYILQNRINEYRTVRGHSDLRPKGSLTALAGDRLDTAISENDFGHMGLCDDYDFYDIDAREKKEYFIVGASSPDEVMYYILRDDEVRAEILESDSYRRFAAVSVTKPSCGIAYWAIEMYR